MNLITNVRQSLVQKQNGVGGNYSCFDSFFVFLLVPLSLLMLSRAAESQFTETWEISLHPICNLYRANGRGGFGSQTAADPLRNPRRAPEKQTVGTGTASHKMLSLQAVSSSLNAGTAKRGCLGRGEAFGCPLAVCPPKRPRPF